MVIEIVRFTRGGQNRIARGIFVLVVDALLPLHGLRDVDSLGRVYRLHGRVGLRNHPARWGNEKGDNQAAKQSPCPHVLSQDDLRR